MIQPPAVTFDLFTSQLVPRRDAICAHVLRATHFLTRCARVGRLVATMCRLEFSNRPQPDERTRVEARHSPPTVSSLFSPDAA